MTAEDHPPSAHAGRQAGRLGRRMRSMVISPAQGWRWTAAAVAAPVLVFAALPAAARPVAAPVRTIHLVAQETQRKFPRFQLKHDQLTELSGGLVAAVAASLR
jgi:hypothetical protein